jgi:hypothetical protein
VNRFCSIFSQLLKLFPRPEFERLVQQTRAERHARGFASWDQFVAMLFCQLGRAQSLREICGGLASCEGKLTHLGIAAPARSTLAYANAHRPWQLFEAVFYELLQRCQQRSVQRGQKLRFKNKLLSIDATTIELCATVVDWPQYGRTKGAVKLHLVLDHDGYLPTFMVIRAAAAHEITVARSVAFQPGTIVVMDRGYLDYAWYEQLTHQGVCFVTRPRRNMDYAVIRSLPLPPRGRVLRDELIRLRGTHGAWRCGEALRRIEVRRADTGEVLTLLTNHLTFAASTIAAIYKERWQIELFFKALKQNLRIKTFVGTTATALQTQIWTALIAMLLLRYLQLRSTFAWSLSHLVALLRMNLFTHRDLWRWLNRPYEQPPPLPQPVQMTLAFR